MGRWWTAGRLDQVWLWAARQAGAPAGIPSGVGGSPQSSHSFAEPMGRPRQRLGLIQRGNGQEQPLHTLARRAAITFTRIIWIDGVYLKGLGWLQACCSSVAATPRLSWNLRVTPDDQALIDRAVRTSGLTRTDFVLQAARNAARELLVQQAWQAIEPEQFDQFLRQLNAPPTPSDRLQRTMTAPRPWQR